MYYRCFIAVFAISISLGVAKGDGVDKKICVSVLHLQRGLLEKPAILRLTFSSSDKVDWEFASDLTKKGRHALGYGVAKHYLSELRSNVAETASVEAAISDSKSFSTAYLLVIEQSDKAPEVHIIQTANFRRVFAANSSIEDLCRTIARHRGGKDPAIDMFLFAHLPMNKTSYGFDMNGGDDCSTSVTADQ